MSGGSEDTALAPHRWDGGLRVAPWRRILSVLVAAALLLPGSAAANESCHYELLAPYDFSPPPGPAYRWLAQGALDRDVETRLPDGIVVALEKLPRRALGDPDPRTWLRPYPVAGHATQARQSLADAALSHPRMQVPTHVMRYRGGAPCLLATRYDGGTARRCDGAQRIAPFTAATAIAAMERTVESELGAALDTGRFTHLLVLSMGWANDQCVSLGRYREMLREAGGLGGDPSFRPYVLGLTWPSAWFSTAGGPAAGLGHIGSYFNKAGDADEAGLLVANVLLNRTIPRANARAGLPVVLVGHSMGARLLSRALMSRPLLRDPGPRDDADLALLLQPALSAMRFHPGAGVEGAPYAATAFPPGARPTTPIVATTSRCDAANPVALWSAFLGSERGRRWAARRPATFCVSPPLRSGAAAADWAGRVRAARPGCVAVANATFVGEHNDILDAEAGAFLRGLVLGLGRTAR